MIEMSALKYVFTLLALTFLVSCKQPVHWNAGDVAGAMPDLAFTLTGPDGETVDAKDFRGKPVLLFFGFTHCQHVCPMTLARLTVLMKQLGPDARDLQVLLVTVDPERDTPEAMKTYTAAFGPWLLGLTGSEEALTQLRESYGVYSAMESSDSKGDYNIMHSSIVFAFDADGKVRLLLSDLSDGDAVVADLRQLINL